MTVVFKNYVHTLEQKFELAIHLANKVKLMSICGTEA